MISIFPNTFITFIHAIFRTSSRPHSPVNTNYLKSLYSLHASGILYTFLYTQSYCSHAYMYTVIHLQEHTILVLEWKAQFPFLHCMSLFDFNMSILYISTTSSGNHIISFGSVVKAHLHVGPVNGGGGGAVHIFVRFGQALKYDWGCGTPGPPIRLKCFDQQKQMKQKDKTNLVWCLLYYAKILLNFKL